MSEQINLNAVAKMLIALNKNVNIEYNCETMQHNVSANCLIDMANLNEVSITFHLPFNCNEC